jgi:cold-inducible RNA-binding protein
MQNIFIGNLSVTTTEEVLRTAFESFGIVLSATIVKDRDSGLARGFGFVEMSSDAEAQAAVAALDGMMFEGRQIRVSLARQKSPATTRSTDARLRSHRRHRY